MCKTTIGLSLAIFGLMMSITALVTRAAISETPRDEYRVVELHRSTDLNEVAQWANSQGGVEIVQVFNLRAVSEPVMVLYRKK